MTPESAKGHVEQSARQFWIAAWFESLWQDACYAVRTLRKSPGFALTAIVTLTVTTGLTTNFFALAEGLLYKPWPVPDPDRVIVVEAQRRYSTAQPGVFFGGMFLEEYGYLRENARSVDLFAFEVYGARIGPLSNQSARLVSGNYFRALRLPIIQGRPLVDADDDRGHPTAVTVISHEIWLNQFGGAPVVGTSVKIDEVSFTIVGIAGPGATDERRLEPARAWMPLASKAILEPQRAAATDPEDVQTIAGRLATGATRARADVELKALHARLQPTQIRNGTVTTTLRVTSTALAGQDVSVYFNRKLALVSVAPVVVLLLGCANVANLQLARAFSRRKEIAVRMALGASRVRIVRQLLVDGLLLSMAAGCLSVVIAYFLPRAILVWYEPGLATASFDLTPNWRVFGFASALAFATCVVSGLLPAVRATRIGPQYVGIERGRLRSVLLTVQVALCVVVLLGTGLLLRGIHYGTGSGLGFDLSSVAAMRFTLPEGFYDAAQRRQFTATLLDTANSSGLQPIAVTGAVPLTGGNLTTRVKATGGEATFDAYKHFVSPGYFDALGIPLRAGRVFTSDRGANEAVINETLAARLWPGLDSVGKTLVYEGNEKRVVGVVADARTEFPDRVEPGIYEAVVSAQAALVHNDPVSIAHLQSIIVTLEPRATTKMDSMVSGLWEQLHTSVVVTWVVSAMSILALLIATVGTFGVFSYLVGERTREIGVRIALGARARHVVSLLAARLCWPLAIGLGLGLLAAEPLSAVVRSQIFGVSVHDPLAYAAVLAVLSLSAFAALIGPLRRALRVDPAVTLRHD